MIPAPPNAGLRPAAIPSGGIPATIGATRAAADRLGAATDWHRPLIIAALLATGLFVSMGLDLPSLTLIFGTIAVGIAVVSPTTGVALLAIMVPLREPEIFGPVWLNVALAGATFVGCVFRLPVDRPLIIPSAGFLLLVGYLLYSIVTLPTQVSGFDAVQTETAVYQFLQLVGGIAIFTAAYLVFERVDAIPILVAGTVSGGIAAVLGIVFLAAGSDDLPFRGVFSPAPWFSRAVGPFGNTNYYGEYLAFAIVIAIGLMGVVRANIRPVLGVALAFMAVAFVLTFSRGAIVTLGVGLVVLAFARSIRLGIIVALIGLLVALVVLPVFLEARLEASFGASADISSDLSSSDETRLDAFAAGIRLFESAPLFGIGFGQFQEASGQFIIDAATTYPHNSAIRVLAEQGIVGALMAGGVVLALGRSLWRSVHPLRMTAVAVLTSYLAGSILLEPFWSIQTSAAVWILFAAVLAPQLTRIDRPQPVPALAMT